MTNEISLMRLERYLHFLICYAPTIKYQFDSLLDGEQVEVSCIGFSFVIQIKSDRNYCRFTLLDTELMNHSVVSFLGADLRTCFHHFANSLKKFVTDFENPHAEVMFRL